MGVTATEAELFEKTIDSSAEIVTVAAANTEVVGGIVIMGGVCFLVE